MTPEQAEAVARAMLTESEAASRAGKSERALAFCQSARMLTEALAASTVNPALAALLADVAALRCKPECAVVCNVCALARRVDAVAVDS